MINIFDKVDEFFASLNDYLTFNRIFISFIALFLVVCVAVIITTSKAYESKLIRSIDKFNQYFIDNPKITEDNLVAFNDRMKSDKVPKQLRKQWQAYVLYREKPASYYMSFNNCVATPIKNSTFKRDIKIMNFCAYIFATIAFLLNLYRSYETFCTDPSIPETTAIGSMIVYSLLAPIIILVLNFILTIFLDIRHGAIVSDLYQNYQYFEVNIDKATQTLPDYVDYEVLFDKNEIKKGIPILYAYLQKRAEEEQKELERARLKNVEHEKFNFDESGVERSLVLDRAMQEAENYIAERKKLMEDMQAINNDMNSEELDYREVTKEYQRQMQVSKETFENFKSQLDQASSSIETNYIKKQQQQELDRQRNLEKDYDTATDRHKKIIDNYQEELTAVENEIKKIRKILENSMMSEFDAYSTKVYDAAEKVVAARNANKMDRMRQNIKLLEEQLLLRDQNANFNNEFKSNTEASKIETLNAQISSSLQDVDEDDEDEGQPLNIDDDFAASFLQKKDYDTQDDDNTESETSEEETSETEELPSNYVGYSSYGATPSNANDNDENEGEFTFKMSDSEDELNSQQDANEGDEIASNNFTSQNESKSIKRPGRPRKIVDESLQKQRRPVGRPRKVVDESEPKEKRPVGRPKKEKVNADFEMVARKRGRPRKEETIKNEDGDIDAFLREIDAEIERENQKLQQSEIELEKKANRISKNKSNN